MARCSHCGNDYDKAFSIEIGGERYTLDSFECAIHRLAPICGQCGCRIIGHGVEIGKDMYCCAHCARECGSRELKDRA